VSTIKLTGYALILFCII